MTGKPPYSLEYIYNNQEQFNILSLLYFYGECEKKHISIVCCEKQYKDYDEEIIKDLLKHFQLTTNEKRERIKSIREWFNPRKKAWEELFNNGTIKEGLKNERIKYLEERRNKLLQSLEVNSVDDIFKRFNNSKILNPDKKISSYWRLGDLLPDMLSLNPKIMDFKVNPHHSNRRIYFLTEYGKLIVARRITTAMINEITDKDYLDKLFKELLYKKIVDDLDL